MSKTNIRNTSKQILESMLLKSMQTGMLDIYFSYEDIALEVEGLTKTMYSLCRQYLAGLGLVHYTQQVKDGKELMQIAPKAIDFVECPDN